MIVGKDERVNFEFSESVDVGGRDPLNNEDVTRGGVDTEETEVFSTETQVTSPGEVLETFGVSERRMVLGCSPEFEERIG